MNPPVLEVENRLPRSPLFVVRADMSQNEVGTNIRFLSLELTPRNMPQMFPKYVGKESPAKFMINFPP